MANFRILVVDDSPTMRRIVINTLKRAGYTEVVEADDGKDALAKMAVESINFVITDWDMPEMDGSALITAIRSNEKLKALPILMVTPSTAKDCATEALKAGLNDYIVKPFTPEMLKDKIQACLA